MGDPKLQVKSGRCPSCDVSGEGKRIWSLLRLSLGSLGESVPFWCQGLLFAGSSRVHNRQTSGGYNRLTEGLGRGSNSG